MIELMRQHTPSAGQGQRLWVYCLQATIDRSRRLVHKLPVTEVVDLCACYLTEVVDMR